MRKAISLFLICSLVAPHALAVDAKKVQYIGGTIEKLRQGKDSGKEGELDLKNEKELVMVMKGETFAIPYAKMETLEYQHASSFRAGAVTAIGATAIFIIPLVFLPFALKKKKKHFLTIAYKDAEDKNQAVIYELGKDVEKEARAVIAARSGKTIKIYKESDTQ